MERNVFQTDLENSGKRLWKTFRARPRSGSGRWWTSRRTWKVPSCHKPFATPKTKAGRVNPHVCRCLYEDVCSKWMQQRVEARTSSQSLQRLKHPHLGSEEVAFLFAAGWDLNPLECSHTTLEEILFFFNANTNTKFHILVYRSGFAPRRVPWHMVHPPCTPMGLTLCKDMFSCFWCQMCRGGTIIYFFTLLLVVVKKVLKVLKLFGTKN